MAVVDAVAAKAAEEREGKKRLNRGARVHPDEFFCGVGSGREWIEKLYLDRETWLIQVRGLDERWHPRRTI